MAFRLRFLLMFGAVLSAHVLGHLGTTARAWRRTLLEAIFCRDPRNRRPEAAIRFRVRVRTDRGHLDRRSRQVQVYMGIYDGPFGTGAGYVGGATFTVARNCIDPTRNLYKPRRLVVRLTQNGNSSPWVRH